MQHCTRYARKRQRIKRLAAEYISHVRVPCSSYKRGARLKRRELGGYPRCKMPLLILASLLIAAQMSSGKSLRFIYDHLRANIVSA